MIKQEWRETESVYETQTIGLSIQNIILHLAANLCACQSQEFALKHNASNAPHSSYCITGIFSMYSSEVIGIFTAKLQWMWASEAAHEHWRMTTIDRVNQMPKNKQKNLILPVLQV